MADEPKMEDKKADAARADADSRMDEMFDKLLKGIDSIRSDVASCNSRMDAFEKKEEKEEPKKDASEEEEAKADGSDEELEKAKAERLAADKAKKDSKRMDAEKKEEEKEEAKADSAAISSLKRQLEDQKKTMEHLAQLVRQPIPEMDRAELTSAQARADEAMIKLGERAPQPLVGESPMAYRRRMVSSLQKHSDRWKKTDVLKLDESTFSVVESDVYADAAVRAKAPNDIGPGKMREVRRQDPSGHIITEFFGGGDTHFVKGFSRGARKGYVGINR